VTRVQVEIGDDTADETADERRGCKLRSESHEGKPQGHPRQRVCRQHHTSEQRGPIGITSTPESAAFGAARVVNLKSRTVLLTDKMTTEFVFSVLEVDTWVSK
jgi:hypothetical protein